MEFRYYQNMAKRYITSHVKLDKPNTLLYLGMRLGDACNDVFATIRSSNTEISPESLHTLKVAIGNLLFIVSHLCTELNLNMSDVALHNLARLRKQKDSESNK